MKKSIDKVINDMITFGLAVTDGSGRHVDLSEVYDIEALEEVKLIQEGKLPKQSLKEALKGCN